MRYEKRSKKKEPSIEKIETVALYLYDMGERVNNISIFHELKRRGLVEQRDFEYYVFNNIFLKKLKKKGWKDNVIKVRGL